MRLLSGLFLAAALLPACAIPGGAAWSDLHASAFGGGYFGSLGASGNDITVDDSGGGGFDFEGDLNLEDNTETALYYGARFGFAPLELSVSRFGYDGENDGRVSGSTQFGGQPTGGAFDVTSEMDLAVSKVMLGLDVVNTPLFRVGLLAGVDYVEFDRFDLVAQESSGSVSPGDRQTILEDQAAPVPIVGLRGDVAIPFAGRLGGEVTGLKFDFDDADMLYLDWELAAHWEPWEHIELMVGWRAVTMELEGEVDGTSLNLDLDLDGPFAGVTIYW